jgi:ABC-2 type transport system permease protein
MSASLAVAATGLRALRRSIVGWSIGLAGLIAATVAFWPAFKGASGISAAIDALPAGVVSAFGLQDFGSPAGFLRGNLYELFVPLLLVIAGAAFVAGQTAGDERAGRLELFLSQPIGRGRLYAARAAAAFAALAGVAIIALLVQLAMDGAMGLGIEPSLVISTLVLCALLAALHASLAYAIASIRPASALAIGGAVGVALAGYVINALFPLVTELGPLVGISPWQWALGGDPLLHPAEPWRYLALLLPTLVLVVLGTVAIRRRDIAAA